MFGSILGSRYLRKVPYKRLKALGPESCTAFSASGSVGDSWKEPPQEWVLYQPLYNPI